MTLKVKSKVEEALHEKIIGSRPVGGGCIANASLITTESGQEYFLKTLDQKSSDMFIQEAAGLRELSKPNCIRVPEVLESEPDFLLLELIEEGKQSKTFWRDFGRQFAEMHQYQSDYFGFEDDNYCGLTPQKNTPKVMEEPDSWWNFYFENRLMFQAKLAESKGHGSEVRKLLEKSEKHLSDLVKPSEEPPSLLHGDLWGGNYLVGPEGEPVLIDPAAYYGHREADLAMTRLFGSFDDEFYEAYNDQYPLKDGWQDRENLYKLYHVLNHLNLFGSGYYSQAMSLLKSYT